MQCTHEAHLKSGIRPSVLLRRLSIATVMLTALGVVVVSGATLIVNSSGEVAEAYAEAAGPGYGSATYIDGDGVGFELQKSVSTETGGDVVHGAATAYDGYYSDLTISGASNPRFEVFCYGEAYGYCAAANYGVPTWEWSANVDAGFLLLQKFNQGQQNELTANEGDTEGFWLFSPATYDSFLLQWGHDEMYEGYTDYDARLVAFGGVLLWISEPEATLIGFSKTDDNYDLDGYVKAWDGSTLISTHYTGG